MDSWINEIKLGLSRNGVIVLTRFMMMLNIG